LRERERERKREREKERERERDRERENEQTGITHLGGEMPPYIQGCQLPVDLDLYAKHAHIADGQEA
jgi:hypothetical protein